MTTTVMAAGLKQEVRDFLRFKRAMESVISAPRGSTFAHCSYFNQNRFVLIS
jgi:hypothetical protein